MASVEPPVKRKRGRPPGPYGPYSKNKKKIVETSRPSNRSRGRGRGVRGRGERELSLSVGWMIVSVFLTPLIKTGEDSVIGLILLLTC